MTVQCAWCLRLQQGGAWRRGAVPAGEVVSHGVCPVCAERLAKRWGLGDGSDDFTASAG
ncbi:MAG: hypothetical protein JW909_06850 [Planctomycetes bacterium]|nr:hypothetical protein [Planctomycetota bacterium]